MAACECHKCPGIKLIFAFMQIGSWLMNPFKVIGGVSVSWMCLKGEDRGVYFGKKAVKEGIVI